MKTNKRQILIEGRVEDLKAKYVDNPNLEPVEKLREKKFDVLVSYDPSGNQKYLEWMIKVMISGYALGVGTHYVVGLVKEFHEKRQRLPKKDLYQYSGYNELEKALKNLQPSKGEMKKIQKEGSHKLYEDDKWLVVVPLTEDGSCYYGQGTKWCTSAKRQNQFDNYREDGTLIYIINKSGDVDSGHAGWAGHDYSKIAIYIPLKSYKKGMKHLDSPEIQIFDAKDQSLDGLNDGSVLWSDFIDADYETKDKMQDVMVKYFKSDWNERASFSDYDDARNEWGEYAEGLENLIYIKGLLNEGRLEDVKKKYIAKYLYLEMELDPSGDEESFRSYFNNLVDYISREDPSGNNKYLNWFFKNWLENMEFNVSVSSGPVDPEMLLSAIKTYHRNLSRITPQSLPTSSQINDRVKKNPKDINSYDITSLSYVVNYFGEIERKKEEEKKAKKDIDVVYDDQYLMVIHPKTKESSCKYGATTQWCTAATQSDNMFESYSAKGNLYYHIWKINMPSNKRDFQKVARYIEYGGQYEEEGDFFIANDDQYDENGVLQQMFSGKRDEDGNVMFSNVYKPFWDSWQNAKIKIDTHYAMNGLHKEKEYIDDEDEWDEYDDEDDDYWDDEEYD
jgi:hypothetical protein